MSAFAGKRIVAPVDISELSMETVKEAVRLADKAAAVDVIHVLPGETPPDPRRAADVQYALTAKLTEDGLGEARVTTKFGSPGKTIADFAQENDAGLIVISSHGRTGIDRFVLGSVAEKVVRLATCPVLVIKPSTTS